MYLYKEKDKTSNVSLEYETLVRIISDIDMALDFVIEASPKMLVHYKGKGICCGGDTNG